MERKIVELFLEGKSSREVMQHLKVGDRRVRKIRLLAEEYGYLGKEPANPLPVYPEALFPDGPDGRESKGSAANNLILERKPWIVERLVAGWHPITIFEELGISVGRSSFYRFLNRHGLWELKSNIRRVVPEIVHEPGEALLLDWGKLRDVVDSETGKKQTIWAFVGVLGYSRYLMVRLVWSNETRLTLTAIESMLREIGGVPSRVTSDNPKCFALEASRYEPLLNPTFERMAAHYGMRIECLPPRDPQKKGKVERPMSYVRRLYEAHGQEWQGIEESQGYMEKKLLIANERKHGTTGKRPIDQLQAEIEKLRPLPPLAYEPEETSFSKVRKDGHVRFDGKYYSVEEKLIGEEILVLATQTQVSLYHEGRLLEIHDRISASDSLRSKSTKTHHLKPWEREMQNDALYRQRAQKLGPEVERFVTAILNQGEAFVGIRKVWGILSLDKSYAPPRINEACRQALELGTLSYRMVKSLLNVPEAKEASESKFIWELRPTGNKFVRPLSDYEEGTIH